MTLFSDFIWRRAIDHHISYAKAAKDAKYDYKIYKKKVLAKEIERIPDPKQKQMPQPPNTLTLEI